MQVTLYRKDKLALENVEVFSSHSDRILYNFAKPIFQLRRNVLFHTFSYKDLIYNVQRLHSNYYTANGSCLDYIAYGVR